MELTEVLVIGTIAGLTTTAGGLIAALLPIHNEKCLRLLFGFAGGVMLGLSLFQLMPEGYFFSGSIFAVSFGFIVGILIMMFLAIITGTEKINAEKVKTSENMDFRKTGIFICIALALHNLPEGVAVGVGFVNGSDLGFMIAFAMALHNIPEGIGIGAPLKRSGMKLSGIVLLTTAAGIVTPVGSYLGWWMGHVSASALGWSMGLAAGAMVYVAITKLLVFSGKWNSAGVFFGILLTFIIA